MNELLEYINQRIIILNRDFDKLKVEKEKKKRNGEEFHVEAAMMIGCLDGLSELIKVKNFILNILEQEGKEL